MKRYTNSPALTRERMVLDAMDLGHGWTSIQTLHRRTALPKGGLLSALDRLVMRGKAERSPIQPAHDGGYGRTGRTLFYRRRAPWDGR